MSPTALQGRVLWRPSPERVRAAKLTGFMRWLADHDGVDVAGYHDLWTWSVADVGRFWDAVRRHYRVGPDELPGPALVRRNGAEGANWFPGVTLNYVDGVLGHDDAATAVVAVTEDGEHRAVSFGELRAAAGAVAAALSEVGVGPGDRVGAVMTNSAEAVVAFLATASLGAVWSSCAPEFGVDGIVDRFGQIEPKVLFVTAGYRYGGRPFSLAGKLAAVESALPSLAATVVVAAPEGADVGRSRPGGATGTGVRRLDWDEVVAGPASRPVPLAPRPVPFDHPLWVLYSSGTTGLPKPIVQGHGGIVLEHLKALGLHCDLGPGDRFFWFTTTGWVMWNMLVGGLLVGATVVCYHGSPTWPDHRALWRMAHRHRVTYFGTSAPFIEACRRQGLSLRDGPEPTSIHTIGSTGAPLSPEGYVWASTAVGDDVQVASLSGGTDVATALLGASPLLDVRAGEIQCRMLGVDAQAFDGTGRPVVDEVGELVVREPMPSMPLSFWGDADGSRLHEAYFDHFPGVWRHGDWVRFTADGGSVVFGRSDATLNRDGVRMGTAEYYRVVESLPEVVDSLVVDTSGLDRHGQLLLFVVLAEQADQAGQADRADQAGQAADEPAGAPPYCVPPAVEAGLREALRSRLSPRHVPDVFLAVPALPHTINGKRLEVPVRRIVLGEPVDRTVATAALDRPEALAALVDCLDRHGLRAQGHGLRAQGHDVQTQGHGVRAQG
ncbi:MAG TPA: acetoacetate--CoA ligase [Acidimicrobiales bacterium]|nr:acetoacetate--CoA ligase [Acidimicrobiales bacterium]